MKKSSPKVIVNQKYTLSMRVNNKNIDKKIDGMIDYYSRKEKRMINIIDYYTGDINKSENMNLLLEDGNYATETDIIKRKKIIKKCVKNSNMWQGIISFNNDYINENIEIEKLEKELMTNILPRYFKSIGFDSPKKMIYQASLHTDTDNLHFHYSFLEKEKNYKKGKNIDYRKSGKISLQNIDFLKSLVMHTIEKEKIYKPLLIKTNKEIDELKKYFKYNEKNFLLDNKKDLILEYNLLKLGELLNKDGIGLNGKIKYNSVDNDEIKCYVVSINEYLKKDESYKKELERLKSNFQELNYYFEKINLDLDVHSKDTKKLIEYKKDYINTFINNAIINNAKNKYKSVLKTNENNLLKYIVMKNYKEKQFNKSPYNVLKNHLTSSNKNLNNKSMIINSVKKINQDLENAQEEFSKFFSADENTNKKER